MTGMRNKVSIAASKTPAHADVAADRLRHGDRNGARFDAGKKQREEILVPGQDQAEHRGRREAGDDLRQADLEEDAGVGRAVEPGSIFDIGRQFVEEALHHPDREGQVEGGVERDDAGIAAGEPDDPEHQDDRNDHHDRRQHAGGENDEEIGIVALERITREAESGERSDDQREEDARAGDEDRVEEVEIEVRGLRNRSRRKWPAEHAVEIFERRREQEFRRHRQRIVHRFEGREMIHKTGKK